MNKIVIIGCGNVGMSYAYALLNQKVNVNELVLIDKNEEKVLGEVMDLNHCLAFAPNKINIKTGTYKDVKNADIIVIAAGAFGGVFYGIVGCSNSFCHHSSDEYLYARNTKTCRENLL